MVIPLDPFKGVAGIHMVFGSLGFGIADYEKLLVF